MDENDSMKKEVNMSEEANLPKELKSSLKDLDSVKILREKNQSSIITFNNGNNNSMTKCSNTKSYSRSLSLKIKELLGFEKYENFHYYFPNFNCQNIIKNFNRTRRKIAYVKHIHPSRQSIFQLNNLFESKNKKDNKIPLNNLGNYSFFAQHYKEKIIVKKSMVEADLHEPNKRKCESSYFKKKDFQTKTSFNFYEAVSDIMKDNFKKLLKKKKSEK